MGCVVVAIKFCEDEYFNNRYYAKVGGVTLKELNKVERRLLMLLNYCVHVTKEEFEKYLKFLEEGTEDKNTKKVL